MENFVVPFSNLAWTVGKKYKLVNPILVEFRLGHCGFMSVCFPRLGIQTNISLIIFLIFAVFRFKQAVAQPLTLASRLVVTDLQLDVSDM